MATIVTPNVQEARLLLSHLQGTGPEEQKIKSVADMVTIARKPTRQSGVGAVLVKTHPGCGTGTEGVNVEWAQSVTSME